MLPAPCSPPSMPVTMKISCKSRPKWTKYSLTKLKSISYCYGHQSGVGTGNAIHMDADTWRDSQETDCPTPCSCVLYLLLPDLLGSPKWPWFSWHTQVIWNKIPLMYFLKGLLLSWNPSHQHQRHLCYGNDGRYNHQGKPWASICASWWAHQYIHHFIPRRWYHFPHKRNC